MTSRQETATKVLEGMMDKNGKTNREFKRSLTALHKSMRKMKSLGFTNEDLHNYIDINGLN